METDQAKCDNIDMFESAAHMNSELNKSSQSENSKIVLQDESNASADVESKLENDQKDVENLIHDSMDHGAQSEEETGKDSSGESSVNADSESTLSAPEAIAHQNMQDHEAAMAEECSQGEIIDEKIERKEVSICWIYQIWWLYLCMTRNKLWYGRAFNIFQVYQYFTIYRGYFLLKLEQFSWISCTTLVRIRRYQRQC